MNADISRDSTHLLQCKGKAEYVKDVTGQITLISHYPWKQGLSSMKLWERMQSVSLTERQICYRFLRLCLVLVTPLMVWSALKVLTNCSLPVLVVQSGGLGPLFFMSRGDVLFLTNYEEEPVRVGEIIVFRVAGRDIPIAHRVIKVHEKEDKTLLFLTKGDDNIVDDRGLYPEGQHWLSTQNVIGKARGYIPYIGILAIIALDNPVKLLLLTWIFIHILMRR